MQQFEIFCTIIILNKKESIFYQKRYIRYFDLIIQQ